jgi:hypothetical protein
MSFLVLWVFVNFIKKVQIKNFFALKFVITKSQKNNFHLYTPIFPNLFFVSIFT